MFSTYSFSDVSFVLSHPNVGMFVFNGQGLGSVTVSFANDLTQHDIAADGSVMVSKFVSKNGTLALSIQQTSPAHKFLKRWLSYLRFAPTSEWAMTTGVLRIPAQGEIWTFSGISPQKGADAAYQQTGQQYTWNLMAAEINC